MDSKTVALYDSQAKTFAKRHENQIPQRLYELAKTFFKRGAYTADIGCGIGRDTAWLENNGFPSNGFDPSDGMLNIAKKSYPNLHFKTCSLPELNMDSDYVNIFCCAVLMHIPRSSLVSSAISLLKALKPNGRLVLSYRPGQGETDGRLFETYHPGQIAQLFESLGGKVLLIERDGIWENLVIEKQDLNIREGIQLIQDIITTDRKVATYKFALIRALCEISRYEAHTVTWYRDGDMVLVPMQRIAARWVQYYWPLVQGGLKQTTSKSMAFENQLAELPYKPADMALLKNALDEISDKKIISLINKVSETIRKGPVEHSGGTDLEIFHFVPSLDASVYPELKYSENGMVTVPLALWRDINLFSHWIEDSLAIQWAELSTKINKDGKFGHHLDLITKSVQVDERDTYQIRKLLKGKKIECVWTGKKIESFDIDHMIPWTIWRNNDLWNLLPTDPKVNNQKRDMLPNPSLIKAQYESIKRYWDIYEEAFPNLFRKQIQKGLGINGDFKYESIEALEHTLIRLKSTQGGSFWR